MTIIRTHNLKIPNQLILLRIILFNQHIHLKCQSLPYRHRHQFLQQQLSRLELQLVLVATSIRPNLKIRQKLTAQENAFAVTFLKAYNKIIDTNFDLSLPNDIFGASVDTFMSSLPADCQTSIEEINKIVMPAVYEGLYRKPAQLDVNFQGKRRVSRPVSNYKWIPIPKSMRDVMQ